MKILTEGALTTEAESLFQYFTPLTEKADSHWAVVLTLAYLVGVSFKAASSWKEEMQIRIHTQKILGTH